MPPVARGIGCGLLKLNLAWVLTVRLHIPEEKDNEINLRLLVRYMRKLGVDYVTAVNGLEALNIYRASPD